jgi:hypothetical protein
MELDNPKRDKKSEAELPSYHSGPPQSVGGYEKWNWCPKCQTIHTKDIIFCFHGHRVRKNPRSKKRKINERRT